MKKLLFVILLLLLSPAAGAKDTIVLTWSDCVKEAAKYNPELAASLDRINQRKAEKRIAASPMLPQISAQAGAGKTDTFSGGNGRNNNTYSAKGDQLVFDGLKTYNEFKSAKYNVAASEYSYTTASSDIRYNLRKAFAELLKAQALVSITRDIIDRRKQNLDMIELRYESGREHEGALLLAKADLAQAQYDNRKAQRDISVAQYALRQVMGWDNDKPFAVKGSFELQNPYTHKPDLREIAGLHPEVRRVDSEKEAAKHGLKSAKGEFFPQLNVTAEAGKIGYGGFSSDEGWSVGVNASLPLFEGGRRFANTYRARAKLLEVTSGETGQFNTVLANLENTWQKLKDAVELYAVQKKYLEADMVRAKIARAQYANGLLSFDNWIIIEDNYVRSQKTYVAAQAEMLIAEAEWIRTKGEPLEL